MARPARMSMEELEPKLRALRADGVPHKLLADRFGYSVDHIKQLCHKFGITRKRKELKHEIAVDGATSKTESAQ